MRLLLAVLALVGLAGVFLGVLTMIQGAREAPFRFENYGGPGPMLGGLVLTAVSLYLLRNWSRLESGSRETHRR
ncbi:MAG TPA: hypothetical protein VKA25_06600 [Gemmatimonadales bacterium]|nr:hypothetical protein [Gemmatimonadales bacterium]